MLSPRARFKWFPRGFEGAWSCWHVLFFSSWASGMIAKAQESGKHWGGYRHQRVEHRTVRETTRVKLLFKACKHESILLESLHWVSGNCSFPNNTHLRWCNFSPTLMQHKFQWAFCCASVKTWKSTVWCKVVRITVCCHETVPLCQTSFYRQQTRGKLQT